MNIYKKLHEELLSPTEILSRSVTRFHWPDRDTIQKCDAFSLARRVTVNKELSPTEILSRSVTRFHWPDRDTIVTRFHCPARHCHMDL
jgi:hypothetical protein